jgi:hypothetical protein
MENKTVTAVEWFIEQLPIRIVNSHQSEIIKVLEMEKQQIMEAFDTGGLDGWVLMDSEQYYNKTFNTTHDQPKKVLGKIEKSDCQEAAEKRQSEKKNENT